ncbi:MAG: hypothetical protein JXR75_10585 [Rhodobacteraceae bacterium]|nr:hypothetical protein [Paracoccaceae bacterium]
MTAVTMATAGLAVFHDQGLPEDYWLFLKTLLPMVFGAGLSQWLLFPLFARKPGILGWMLDILTFALVVALAGLIAGTLLLPGPGTILGPMVALSLPASSPLAALIYAVGAVSVGVLARRAPRVMAAGN